jgi:hypothetical protein
MVRYRISSTILSNLKPMKISYLVGIFINMFNNIKPKDIAVLILTLTLSTILVISSVAVFQGKDKDGRIEW